MPVSGTLWAQHFLESGFVSKRVARQVETFRQVAALSLTSLPADRSGEDRTSSRLYRILVSFANYLLPNFYP